MNRDKHSRTAGELWEDALAWVRRTGWPTHLHDRATADEANDAWLAATEAQWRATGKRDGEDQYRRLYTAFRAAGHDDEAADCLYVLLTPELELCARHAGRSTWPRVQ